MPSYVKYKGLLYRAVDAEWNSDWKKADDLRGRSQSLINEASAYYGRAASGFKRDGDPEKAREAEGLSKYYLDIARSMNKRSL